MDDLKLNELKRKIGNWQISIRNVILNELFTTEQLQFLLNDLMPESEVIIMLLDLQFEGIIRQTPDGFWVIDDKGVDQSSPFR